MNRPTTRHRPAVSTLIALVLMIWAVPWHGRVALAQNQVLFLSVVDEAGEPVTDLQPDDVVVQWDGENSRTLQLDPVNLPVRVTVIIDNGESAREALQHMREGLDGFLTAMPEDVEVALLTNRGSAALDQASHERQGGAGARSGRRGARRRHRGQVSGCLVRGGRAARGRRGARVSAGSS